MDFEKVELAFPPEAIAAWLDIMWQDGMGTGYTVYYEA